MKKKKKLKRISGLYPPVRVSIRKKKSAARWKDTCLKKRAGGTIRTGYTFRYATIYEKVILFKRLGLHFWEGCILLPGIR